MYTVIFILDPLNPFNLDLRHTNLISFEEFGEYVQSYQHLHNPLNVENLLKRQQNCIQNSVDFHKYNQLSDRRKCSR